MSDNAAILGIFIGLFIMGGAAILTVILTEHRQTMRLGRTEDIRCSKCGRKWEDSDDNPPKDN